MNGNVSSFRLIVLTINNKTSCYVITTVIIASLTSSIAFYQLVLRASGQLDAMRIVRRAAMLSLDSRHLCRRWSCAQVMVRKERFCDQLTL